MNQVKLDIIAQTVNDYIEFNQYYPGPKYTITIEQIFKDIDNEEDTIDQIKSDDYKKKLIDAAIIMKQSEKLLNKYYNLQYRINEYNDAVKIHNNNKNTIIGKMQDSNNNYSEDRTEYDFHDYIKSKNNVIHIQTLLLQVINSIPNIKNQYYN